MPKRSYPKDFPSEYLIFLPNLTWAEQQIVKAYYGLGIEKQQPILIAKTFYTSTYTIRKTLKKAFSKLEKLSS